MLAHLKRNFQSATKDFPKRQNWLKITFGGPTKVSVVYGRVFCVCLEFWFWRLKYHFWYHQNSQNDLIWVFWGYQKWHFWCPNQNSKTTFQYKYPPKTPISTLWEPFWTPEKWFLAILYFWSFSHWNSHWNRKNSELSFPWVKLLNSYIFAFRKQNATRKYNVLFKKTTLKFSHWYVDPPNGQPAQWRRGIDQVYTVQDKSSEMGLRSYCRDCNLILEIRVWLWRLQFNGGD